MGEVVRKHDYVDGKCQHCGDKESDNAGADRACVARAMPHPTPVSVFAEIDPIYNRIQELRAERAANLSATTTLD